MKVDIGNQHYIVKWIHANKNAKSAKYLEDEHYNGITTCIIEKRSQNGDRDESPVKGIGSAICSHLDNYNKQTGRKIALSRALQDFAPCNREKRRLFWGAYIDQIGIRKKKS